MWLPATTSGILIFCGAAVWHEVKGTKASGEHHKTLQTGSSNPFWRAWNQLLQNFVVLKIAWNLLLAAWKVQRKLFLLWEDAKEDVRWVVGTFSMFWLLPIRNHRFVPWSSSQAGALPLHFQLHLWGYSVCAILNSIPWSHASFVGIGKNAILGGFSYFGIVRCASGVDALLERFREGKLLDIKGNYYYIPMFFIVSTSLRGWKLNMICFWAACFWWISTIWIFFFIALF